MPMSEFQCCYSKWPDICSVHRKRSYENSKPAQNNIKTLETGKKNWTKMQRRKQPTHLKSYPCNCCITSGAILRKKNISVNLFVQKFKQLPCAIQHTEMTRRTSENNYQHGVPTKVFLERCLSPASNMHADTPKSANLIAPLESIKIFPACRGIL